MTKIDLYDKKILYELDINARQSAQQIAKKVRLSKVSVINRINKLVKEGVIKNFLTLVNYRKLGFTNYHVYYSLQNLSQKKEEEFIEFLKNEHEVRYILQMDSKWDLMLALYAESSEETDKILNNISNKFGNYIKEIKVFTIVITYYPGRNYLIEKKPSVFTTHLIREKSVLEKIDSIDKKILLVLSTDARISLINLGKKIKIKPDIIRYHLKSLVKKDIIQRFTINLGHEKFGNIFYKILFKINPSLKEEILMSELSQNKYAHRIHHFMGEKIIEADFEVHDFGEIREMLRRIKEKFGDKIIELEILPIYSIHKIEYNPL
ncbi:MAG: winged helix-turn-helix transcriptional regulator [Candidatus Woesearchaeota archaeon]